MNWPHWLGTLHCCSFWRGRPAVAQEHTGFEFCAAHLLWIDHSYCWIAGGKFSYHNYVFNYSLNPHFFPYISNTLCSALFASSGSGQAHTSSLKTFQHLLIQGHGSSSDSAKNFNTEGGRIWNSGAQSIGMDSDWGLQTQTQLLPTLHAQLGLLATVLEDELQSLQQNLMQSIESQIDIQRKQVELLERCGCVEAKYVKAMNLWKSIRCKSGGNEERTYFTKEIQFGDEILRQVYAQRIFMGRSCWPTGSTDLPHQTQTAYGSDEQTKRFIIYTRTGVLPAQSNHVRRPLPPLSTTD